MAEAPADRIDLDDELHAFLLEVRGGQSVAMAAWAARILDRGSLTMRDLERCFGLGFDR